MRNPQILALVVTLVLALALTLSCSSTGAPESSPPQIEGSSSSNDGSPTLPPNMVLSSSSSNATVYTRFCVINDSCYEVEFYDSNQNCNDYGFIPVSYCPNISGSSSSALEAGSSSSELSSSSNAKYCFFNNYCHEIIDESDYFYNNCELHGIRVSSCPESSSSSYKQSSSSSSFLTAYYTLNTYIIPSIGGTVSVNPSLPSYLNGTQVTLTATPNAGFKFVEWRDTTTTGIKVISTSRLVEITKTINQDRRVYAYFELISSSSNGASSSSYNSSSSRASSSSATPSSSSIAVVYGTPVTYEGETYPTVVIGTQTWFAKNLNYAVDGSKCYDDNPANCTTYGRLYNWVTAMNLPSTCSSNKCSSKILTKHKGICPTGWHISSMADWNTLLSYVDGSSGSLSNMGNYFSNIAGGYLKSTSGWNDYNGASGNGQDTYGFTALPGGYVNSNNGNFFDVGNRSGWWTTYERSTTMDGNTAAAYVQYFVNNSNGNVSQDQPKLVMYSIRCVKD